MERDELPHGIPLAEECHEDIPEKPSRFQVYDSRKAETIEIGLVGQVLLSEYGGDEAEAVDPLKER